MNINDIEKIIKNPKLITKYELTESDHIALVKYNGLFLKYIDEQTEKICIEAVNQNCWAVQYVKNITYDIIYTAVCCDGNTIKYVTKDIITNELIMVAIRQNPLSIRYINYPSETVCISAISRLPISFIAIKNPSYSIIKFALKLDGLLLQYVDNQTDELCRIAVSECGLALDYVKDQNKDLCILAVKQTGLALQFVKQQNIEICLAAVLENKYAIKYIKDNSIRKTIEQIIHK